MMMSPLLPVGELFSCFPVVEPLLCSDFGLDFFVVSGHLVRVLLGLQYRLHRSCHRVVVMFLPLWFPLRGLLLVL